MTQRWTGEQYTRLRDARGLTLRDAADLASRHGPTLPAVTKDHLHRLEQGSLPRVPQLLERIDMVYRADGRSCTAQVDAITELSHLLLKHELSEVREIDGVLFRTCRPEEEEQATNFGGTLLLPRPLLVAAASRGLGPEQIAQRYDVTVEMARFRYNSTGVGRQITARGR